MQPLFTPACPPAGRDREEEKEPQGGMPEAEPARDGGVSVRHARYIIPPCWAYKPQSLCPVWGQSAIFGRFLYAHPLNWHHKPFSLGKFFLISVECQELTNSQVQSGGDMQNIGQAMAIGHGMRSAQGFSTLMHG